MRALMLAALAGLALSHTIAKAVLYGFFTTSIPFFRTPKNADNHGFWVAISEAREEMFIMLLLWGAALGIYLVRSDGTGLKELAPGGSHPAWSPNGTSIAYVRNGRDGKRGAPARPASRMASASFTPPLSTAPASSAWRRRAR